MTEDEIDVTRPPSLPGREAEMLAFIKLSNALISVRPLGGSELFVKRFGNHYADPKFCADAIKQMRDDLHEARIAAVRASRAALSPQTEARVQRTTEQSSTPIGHQE